MANIVFEYKNLSSYKLTILFLLQISRPRMFYKTVVLQFKNQNNCLLKALSSHFVYTQNVHTSSKLKSCLLKSRQRHAVN